MDIEIQLFHESFAEKDPKLFLEHIQRMTSGEAPFFATTLSLVYDKLVEKAFARPTPSDSGVGKSPEVQNVADPCSPFQASTSIPAVSSTASTNGPSSNPQAPAPDPEPEPIPSGTSPPLAWLRCFQCRELATLEDLYTGMRCPACPSRGGKRGRPYMQCTLCRTMRTEPGSNCQKILCGARFR